MRSGLCKHASAFSLTLSIKSGITNIIVLAHSHLTFNKRESNMNLIIILIGLCLSALVVLEGIQAYRDKMFSPRQMMAMGHSRGMPWICHFGASWGDFFLITPLVTAMIYRYGHQWMHGEHFGSIISLILLACLITGVFHGLWSKNASPDCIAWGGFLTPAGWTHLIYMCSTLTVIVLFYFGTENIDQTFLIVASILIGFHIALGNHAVLYFWRPVWWSTTPAGMLNAVIVTIGVWAALFLRCRYMLAHQ